MGQNLTTFPNNSPLHSPRELSRLSPVREPDSVGHLWKRIDKGLNRNANAYRNIGQLTRIVAGIRQRGMSMLQMHPFKLYNVPEAFCPAKGVYGEDNTPYDPAQDSWRTFCIKGGYVGFRSTLVDFPQRTGNSEQIEYWGNPSECPLYAQRGSDLNGGDFWNDSNGSWDIEVLSPSTLLNSVSVVFVGNSGDYSVPTIAGGDTFGAAVWVLNSDLDDFGEIYASWWVEIDDSVLQDDPFSPDLVQIKCRMFTGRIGDSTGRDPHPFPISESAKVIIPLAITSYVTSEFNAFPSPTNTFSIDQIVYDHVLNRYGQGYGKQPACGAMHYRGLYDDTDDPAYYWPGDVITIRVDPDPNYNYRIRPAIFVGDPGDGYLPQLISSQPDPGTDISWEWLSFETIGAP